jgi:uncharacterized membrane protein HdeD (DUF308 family)
MDLSTPKPQEQSGLPPEEAFWKALAFVGITSLAVWSAIWIFVGLRAGFQGKEWVVGLIPFLLTVLLLTPAVYYNYLRGPQARKRSRGVSIFLGICYVCMSAGRIVDVLQRRTHRDLWVEIVFTFANLLLAAFFFYRAFKSNDTVSLPS